MVYPDRQIHVTMSQTWTHASTAKFGSAPLGASLSASLACNHNSYSRSMFKLSNLHCIIVWLAMTGLGSDPNTIEVKALYLKETKLWATSGLTTGWPKTLRAFGAENHTLWDFPRRDVLKRMGMEAHLILGSQPLLSLFSLCEFRLYQYSFRKIQMRRILRSCGIFGEHLSGLNY